MTSPANPPDLTGPLSGVTAGPYTDAVTGERHVLIQDPGSRVLKDPALLAAARRTLHAVHPRAESTLMRTPPETELPPPWRRHLTYVRCANPARLPDLTGGPEVTPSSGPEDDALVRAWLARAFVAAGEDMRRPVSEVVALAEAAALCGLPDRVSLMARRDGRTIGHATLRVDSEDEVTGEPIAELVDILVEGVPDTGFVTSVLSRAAVAHAHALGRPLIGNVVHPVGPGPDAGTEDPWRVVTRLLQQGWTVDHEYWWAPAPEGENPGAERP